MKLPVGHSHRHPSEAPRRRADVGGQQSRRFVAHTEASTGAELPRFIEHEFDAFRECGILAHGVLWLRCAKCGHDKLLAFSCKRRGFCPSCSARRMSQTATGVNPVYRKPHSGLTHVRGELLLSPWAAGRSRR